MRAESWFVAIRLFDDMPEGEASGAIAKFEEFEGVGVMVDGGAGLQIVLLHDGVGADPLEKGFLNKQAGRMLADFTGAFEVGEVLLFVFGVGSVASLASVVFGGAR
jgi:hypothetical protein